MSEQRPALDTAASGQTEAVGTSAEYEADYLAFRGSVQASISAAFQPSLGGLFFTTDAADLFETYLEALPEYRQQHRCNTCRRFIEGFGGLVCIAPGGTQAPALWSPGLVSGMFAPAARALHDKVMRARVTGVFLSGSDEWGTHQTGLWTHLAGFVPTKFKHATLTPGQAMAARREDYRTLSIALAEFGPKVLDDALHLLRSEALPSSERFVAPAAWLRDIHTRRDATRAPRLRENIVWRAVASAPAGWCTPRSSVIGSLLEDIGAGMDFQAISRRFIAKVDPLRFQRPQAAPSAGNVAQAEKLIETMGLAPALARRYARLDDLQTLWTPRPPAAAAAKPGGVFAGLAVRGPAAERRNIDIPAQAITWEKFARTVLPSAEAMEVVLPKSACNFLTMLTAADPAAPPLLKWDTEEERNPVSWYVYPTGSLPEQYGLRGGTSVPVSAVVPLPTLWGSNPKPYLGEGVILLLAGAKDSRNDSGSALFPALLRPELHAVRATIEAHSLRTPIQGAEQAAATGIDIRKGVAVHRSAPTMVRVLADGRASVYSIDRWD